MPRHVINVLEPKRHSRKRSRRRTVERHMCVPRERVQRVAIENTHRRRESAHQFLGQVGMQAAQEGGATVGTYYPSNATLASRIRAAASGQSHSTSRPIK